MSTSLEAPAPEAAPPRHHRGSRPRRRALLVAAPGLALVAGGAAAYLVADQGGATSSAAATLAPYRDPARSFSISSPQGWAASALPDGVLFSQSGTQNAISVKKVTLAHPVDGSNVEALRAVTDAVLGKPEAGLTVLRSGAVTIGGLPGVYYVYRFPGGAGEQGAHTHYFAFSGRDMYTLVFQALPAAGFEALAPTFDAVAGSFRAAG